jgi:hypothetical protein
MLLVLHPTIYEGHLRKINIGTFNNVTRKGKVYLVVLGSKIILG